MANITVSYIFPGSEVIDSVLQELDNSELEGSDDEEGGLASSTSNSDCGPTRQIGFFEDLMQDWSDDTDCDPNYQPESSSSDSDGFSPSSKKKVKEIY